MDKGHTISVAVNMLMIQFALKIIAIGLGHSLLFFRFPRTRLHSLKKN